MIKKQRDSKAVNAIYEQVLSKNFQIIQTFLSQFNDIFSKQGEFDATLGKFENRVNLIQTNSRKIQQIISRSADMYEKKMNSLQQYIFQKVKRSGDNSQFLSTITANQFTPFNINLQSIQKFSIQQKLQHNQKSALQNKKLQFLTEHLKKLQWQLSTINQRVSSLAQVTNNMDERIKICLDNQKDSFNNHNNDLTAKINEQLHNNLLKDITNIETQVRQNCSQLKRQQTILRNKLNQQLCQFNNKIIDMQRSIDQKLSKKQFDEFKRTYSDDQSCMIREVTQNFANKKQTKKAMHILQKKLFKMETIEQILKENQENRQNLPNSPSHNIVHYTKPKPLTIHTNKKTIKNENNINNSIHIRRLESKKNKQQTL